MKCGCAPFKNSCLVFTQHRTPNAIRLDAERNLIGRRTQSDRAADGIRSDCVRVTVRKAYDRNFSCLTNVIWQSYTSLLFLKTCTYNDGKKQLSTTTCRMFVNYFGSSLAKAVRDGLIEQNLFLLLEAKEKPQKRVAEREFLTIEEIKKVMNTPCRYELVKKAFLFSCFTGLRYRNTDKFYIRHQKQRKS